jgi:hypothetical protein
MAIEGSTTINDQWDFFTTNRTNFHEWGAASPENFIFDMIRVYSKNSWFKCAVLGHPIRIGSLIFYELKMSEI